MEPAVTGSPAVSDRQLVQSCLQGDTRSFGLLYNRYQDRVRATLYQLCGADQLDDLVQEVFLRVWKGASSFRHSAQFSTWLYCIAWNVAADRRRQLAKQRSRWPQMAQAIAVQTAETVNSLSHLHYCDLVQRGLAQLSLEHRSALVLHDLQDLPLKNVAEILAVPVGTVKSRLFHARAAMKRYLQQEGVDV
jgi:RNA polymerase sigma-70 factor (ECF subfamily)